MSINNDLLSQYFSTVDWACGCGESDDNNKTYSLGFDDIRYGEYTVCNHCIEDEYKSLRPFFDDIFRIRIWIENVKTYSDLFEKINTMDHFKTKIKDNRVYIYYRMYKTWISWRTYCIFELYMLIKTPTLDFLNFDVEKLKYLKEIVDLDETK